MDALAVSSPVRFVVAALAVAAGQAVAWADRVTLEDGRVLEGRFTKVAGIAVDPLDPRPSESRGEPVLVCDDELVRTMVSKRQVARVDQEAFDVGLERIPIPQRVAEQGRRVAGFGGILEVTPFDEFGRRILSLAAASGRLEVVQGITEITPRWTRVQGIQTEKPLVLDMRLATSSIPRDVLGRVIAQQSDRTSPTARLAVVRLLLQADRFEDARAELDDVLADFPELEEVAAERRTISRLAAARLLEEIRRRGAAGQDRLAMKLLDDFPIDDAGGEMLEAVREARDRYRERRERAAKLVGQVRARVAELAAGPMRDTATEVVAEIERELSFGSLDRLTTFDRVGTDPSVAADRGAALAISGWLAGATAATDNLKLAVSTARVRDLVRRYLGGGGVADREAAVAAIRQEEAGDPITVAAVAALMRPPLEPSAAIAPGLHEFAVPGPGESSVTCLVQLPPEYDPLRRYPAVISLHSAWSTPRNQVEWWAGLPGPDGSRLGQATRHGFIVIAPAWAAADQRTYGFTPREHAAVLGSLRESLRRFSIDTDRVFLSGHSLGADAAWDVGLAHPDLWAGLVLVSPTADRYVTHYWPNARSLPVYVVGGELDRACVQRNATELDRYFFKGFDATYAEYRGRGHEHFADDLLRIFDWLGRKRRTAFPREIEAVSMRPWDRLFWWLEFERAPPRTVILPEEWPPASGVRPLTLEAAAKPGNAISARCGAERVRVWLSPEIVDFSIPLTVTIDGRTAFDDRPAPDLDVLLEDLRLRADRQHPFWAVVESTRGRPD
ncbi:MAG: peptidase [Planctomycetes bacterium]|nr:peptidase [Planctomycetota bacterium]